MGDTNHIVEQQPGGAVHRETPAKRKAEAFDVSQISPVTKDAFKRICGVSAEAATPEDYRHAFESALGKNVVAEILK